MALVTACWGHTPWTPWYTCFIPVLVDRFYLRAQHSLMLSCAFKQGACPLHWYTSFIFCHTSWYTSLITVLVCMFNPSLPRASTLDPPHVSFNHQSYTSLIYIFYSNLYITNINSIHSYLQVLMFNPCCDTHISSELQKVRVLLGIHSNLTCGSQVKFQDNSS